MIYVINILLVIHVVMALLLVLVVLMQRPKSEGLGAAFGGGMTDNLFGAQTTNVLQKFTRTMGGAFIALTLILSMLYSHMARANKETNVQQQLNAIPKPVAPVDKSGVPLLPVTPNPDTQLAPGENLPMVPVNSDTPATSAPTAPAEDSGLKLAPPAAPQSGDSGLMNLAPGTPQAGGGMSLAPAAPLDSAPAPKADDKKKANKPK